MSLDLLSGNHAASRIVEEGEKGGKRVLQRKPELPGSEDPAPTVKAHRGASGKRVGPSILRNANIGR